MRINFCIFKFRDSIYPSISFHINIFVSFNPDLGVVSKTLKHVFICNNKKYPNQVWCNNTTRFKKIPIQIWYLISLLVRDCVETVSRQYVTDCVTVYIFLNFAFISSRNRISHATITLIHLLRVEFWKIRSSYT